MRFVKRVLMSVGFQNEFIESENLNWLVLASKER